MTEIELIDSLLDARRKHRRAWTDKIRASKADGLRFEMYAIERRRMEEIWELVSKPLKFPDRRRREDRELPKAA